MKIRISLLAIVLFSLLSAESGGAQVLPVTYALLPSNATSADNLKLSLTDQTCGGQQPYVGNPYRVTMSQNNITVTLGDRAANPVPTCPPPRNGREEIDLGRLPAGNYTLSLTETQVINPANLFANAPFTVTDARAAKPAPYVRLDYSGHWWDPNDSGWGLFIWQDARDNTLAAWFTYTPDGKPIWYVFQPGWQTSNATVTTDLLQTSRLPGLTSPPPTATSYAVVGKVSLDFTNSSTSEVGKLTYTFTGGPTLVRNIQRFKP